MIEFSPWPPEFADRYRAAGYWIDQPLTRILETQLVVDPTAEALICGDRRFSYADLDRLSRNLAARLAQAGLGRGDAALVQLPNVAEFYIVFFALLRIGVAPVNALFSHRRLELSSYAAQVAPRAVIASRAHELFRDDVFADELRAGGVEHLLFLGEDAPAHSLAYWLEPGCDLPQDAGPTPADQVAFFQLSGGSTGTPKLIPRTHNDYDYSIRASVAICGVTAATRFLCALPAGHNFTMSSPGVLGVFHAGGTVVMAPSPEPLTCFGLIAREGVTMAPLVPPAVALWLRAVEDDPARRAQLITLETMLVGGANFAEATARRVPELLDCRLQQVFGMAEGLVNYTRSTIRPGSSLPRRAARSAPMTKSVCWTAMAGLFPMARPGRWPRAAPIPSAAIIAAPNTMPKPLTARDFIIRVMSWCARTAICASSAVSRTRSIAAVKRSPPRKSRTCCCAIPTSPMPRWFPCPMRISAKKAVPFW